MSLSLFVAASAAPGDCTIWILYAACGAAFTVGTCQVDSWCRSDAARRLARRLPIGVLILSAAAIAAGAVCMALGYVFVGIWAFTTPMDVNLLNDHCRVLGGLFFATIGAGLIVYGACAVWVGVYEIARRCCREN